MAREGYPYIAGGIGTGIVLSSAGLFFNIQYLLYLAGVSGVLTLFFTIFFRDPERVPGEAPEEIISPADGRVVAIVEEEEIEFFKSRVQRISIFLSIIDVHVNRIPLSGTVDFYRYSKGSFKAAFKEDASQVNEQTIIGISNGKRKVLFKQIAGFVARRIVCSLDAGQTVSKGERFGMIKFGSRVDVFLPVEAEVLITRGQKVYGGVTPVGRFKNDQ